MQDLWLQKQKKIGATPTIIRPITVPAKSKNPDALSTPTDIINPISVGTIPATVFIPSLAPFVKEA